MHSITRNHHTRRLLSPVKDNPHVSYGQCFWYGKTGRGSSLRVYVGQSCNPHGLWSKLLRQSLVAPLESLCNPLIKNYTIFYCTILSYPMLYSTTLYYTILYYTILYYTLLYYTLLLAMAYTTPHPLATAYVTIMPLVELQDRPSRREGSGFGSATVRRSFPETVCSRIAGTVRPWIGDSQGHRERRRYSHSTYYGDLHGYIYIDTCKGVYVLMYSYLS